MKRRQVLVLLAGGAAFRAGLAHAQATPVIGYLSSKDEDSERGIMAAIWRGLNEMGFAEGKNVSFIYAWSAGDYNRLPDLAAGLVKHNVDVIAASGLPAALAAKAATSRIPIVFRLAIDPVAFNLTQSFDKPGGNATGVTMLFDPLTTKKLQLLKELVPGVTKIGFLINPNNQNAASHRDHAQRAADDLNISLSVLTVGQPNDLDGAFAAARKAELGSILVGDDPLFDVLNPKLVRTAAQYSIPTMYYVRDFVVSGGLISYGIDLSQNLRRAADYVVKILKGAKPGDLPVEFPTKLELVINLATAKALGLQVPPTLLARADEVIE